MNAPNSSEPCDICQLRSPCEHRPEQGPDQRSPFPGTGVGNGEHPLYTDVAALLDDGLPDPPEPAFLRRTDDHCVFYAGQVNYLFGDPESGKTLVAQATAAEALIAGKQVVFIDIDHNGAEATICRFLDMDVPEDALRDRDRFRYVEPEDKAHLMQVVADLKQWRPDVAVVDSVGELLPLMNLSSNSPDDFTLAHTHVLKSLAVVGACVIAIDHLAKSTESRAQGSTGTAAKRRAVGGVSIRVTVDEPFTPGRGGSAFLSINKDRHGGLRRHSPPPAGKEAPAGIFKIAPAEDRIAWSVETPQVGDRPKDEQVDAQDLAALSGLDPAPKSVRDVKKRLRWSSERALRVLREWRSERSPTVPPERGTLLDDPAGSPRSPFPTPVPGNGERSCRRCSHAPAIPGDPLDLCRTCAYPPDTDNKESA